ncbi:6829_t:CDS:2 [Cetraspora pellucida]|uniref:6829_t:CDS:1 n=1 Tax=Cetraspora pellucida TaxID=1433469 RepID=A0ACA9MB54_9GLOM|nr:6829_t:CDS:2 [Cetraspora pellucida]
MTQIFSDEGLLIPVTPIWVGDNVISQVKTKEKEGYNACQIAFGDCAEKNLNKPKLGHFKKKNVSPKKYLREIRNMSGFAVGSPIDLSHFEVGDEVDVTRSGAGGRGTNQGMPKNKKMPGRMGNKRVTQKARIAKKDPEKRIIFLRGAVPDLKNKIVGREATTKIVDLLRGKNRIDFTPHLDLGNYVVLINARHISFTGNKLDKKNYYNHSGYSGGLRTRSTRLMLEKYPTELEVKVETKQQNEEKKIQQLQSQLSQIKNDLNKPENQAKKTEFSAQITEIGSELSNITGKNNQELEKVIQKLEQEIGKIKEKLENNNPDNSDPNQNKLTKYIVTKINDNTYKYRFTVDNGRQSCQGYDEVSFGNFIGLLRDQNYGGLDKDFFKKAFQAALKDANSKFPAYF